MLHIITRVFFVCLLSACAQAPVLAQAGPEPSSTMPVYDDLLAEIDRLAAEPGSVQQQRQALELLEQALLTDPADYQVLWRAARTYYKVGDEAADRAKASYFERGIAVGQRAVAQQPTGVEGHFWLGANYGGFSELQGMLKALKTVPKIRTAMQTVLQLQDSYAQGEAYRALGELERQLPGVFGGSVKRAVLYLEQGIQVAPQNLALKLALARAYRDASRDQDSQQLLHEILRTPVRPEQARADQAIHDKARQLLAD